MKRLSYAVNGTKTDSRQLVETIAAMKEDSGEPVFDYQIFSHVHLFGAKKDTEVPALGCVLSGPGISKAIAHDKFVIINSTDIAGKPTYLDIPNDIATLRASASGAALPNPSQVMVSASTLSVPNPEMFAQRSLDAIKAGADFIHFDVVEGNKGKSPILEENSIDTTALNTPRRLREIKQYGTERDVNIPIDVHLIVMNPSENYLKEFIDAGADCILLHWEAFQDKNKLLARLKFIKRHGVEAGIAVRPDVDIAEVGKFIRGMGAPYIDMISQATIYPCYEGQVFAYRALDNIRILRQDFGFKGPIAVDGGVEPELSSKKAIEAGANFLIAGSAFFGDGYRTPQELVVAASSLKNQSRIPYGSVYDIIANRILELRKTKEGKIWVRVMGYHSGGKSVTAQGIIESLKARGRDLSVIDFPQDDFWSAREERRKRKESHDPTYSNGLTHLRINDLNRAIQAIENTTGPVVFDNIYDFDSGNIDSVKQYLIRDDSMMIIEGCYLAAIEKQDFDLTVFIETDMQQAKERAMARDSIKVRRDPAATRELYEDVYEPTYRDYLNRYSPKGKADIILNTAIIDNPRITDALRPLILLECKTCRKQYTSETRITRCISCGGDLEFDIKGTVDFQANIIRSDNSMWRYRRLLPVDEDAIVTAGEGNTPVIYLQDLSKELGIELYAKLESLNPTGTFKDREASFVVSRSKQLGHNDIVMQSTGNTGTSISYYAGLAGIRSYFFGPLLSQYKLLMPEKKDSSKIILVDGEPVDVKNAATNFALMHNFPKVSPFCERCEANATQGYELAEKILDGEIPNFDFYVQTIAAGMGPIGFFSGMERVSKWTDGKVRVPRIVAVQISEFAPIQEAWEEDMEQVGAKGFTPKFASEHPFEPTLHTTNAPAYYPFIRRLLKDSNGILTKVEPNDVLKQEKRFRDSLRRHGVELTDTENSAFVGYAGLVQQIQNGAIPGGSKVVMMVTGKGANKYIEAEPDAVIKPGYDSERLLEELRGYVADSRASASGIEAPDERATQLFEIVEATINNNRARLVKEGNELMALLPESERLTIDKAMAVVEIRRHLEHVLKASDKIELPEGAKVAAADIRKNLDQLEADSIVGGIIALARKAKREDQKLIIGLETDWIPGYNKPGEVQHNAMNPLINEIESLDETLRSLGLDNVIIVHRKSNELADALLKEADSAKTKLSNIIALASEATINSNSFAPLRSTDTEKRAFLAGINPAELEKYYRENKDSLKQPDINIMEMLSITIDLALGKEPPNMPIIISYDRNRRIVIFLPKAVLEDYEKLRQTNSARKLALQAA